MKAPLFSLSDLKSFARRLAHLAQRGDVLLLKGDLGAGKTEFARAFIRSSCGEEMEVPSPTFTLLQVYETASTPIYHFDLYRLETPDDIWELGLEEAFSEGITLIEWPERLPQMILPSSLMLTFSIASPDIREIRLTPQSGWAERLSENV